MTRPEPVLVIGRARLPRAFLAVIRSLGRAGLPVHVLVPEGDSGSALASRYIAAVHRLPSPEGLGSDWVDAVRTLVVDHSIPAVITVDDTSLIPLHVHRSRLGDATGRFALLGDLAYRTSQDKAQQRRLAESLGVAVAPGIVTESVDAATDFARSSLPVVIKPTSSFTPDNLTTKRRVSIARTLPEVAAAMRAGGSPVVVERFFPGIGVGVGFLARDGAVVMAFQHRRIHERIGGGDSTYRVGVPLEPALRAAVEKLAGATEYHGVGMAEFRVGPAGDWVFVELNGRFWGSLPLAVASGADFPYQLYRMVWEGATDFPTEHRTGLFGRNEPRDLQWFWQNLRVDRSDPTRGAVPLPQVFAELGNLLTGRDRWDTLVRDDPAPAWHELTGLARRLWQRLVRRGRRYLGAVTGRGQRLDELRALTTQRPNVLVVCLGNICRSPYAARRLAASLPPGWEVSQGGTLSLPGRSSTTEAITAAAERGIDLSAHVSHPVDAADMDAAGAVLAFDWRIRDELVARYPQHTAKVFLLGEVTPGSVEIADPMGYPVERYRDTYRDIDRRVEELVRGLEAG